MGNTRWFELRRRAFTFGRQVRDEWATCSGYIARRSRGIMPLSSDVERRHPVTILKASLMAGSVRRVWALRHYTGAQYTAVEWTWARVAVRSIVAPAPQPEPASRLRSTTRDVDFLRSDSRCWRHVSDLSNVTTRYFGSEQKGRVSHVKLYLLLRWKTVGTFPKCWALASRMEVFIYGCHVLLRALHLPASLD